MHAVAADTPARRDGVASSRAATARGPYRLLWSAATRRPFTALIWRSYWGAALLAGSMLLLASLPAGCVTTTRTYPPAALNPDALRLQKITGALLRYFQQHHRLPATLSQLTPAASGASQLNFTCPTNGRPYVYAPAPLLGDLPSRRDWLLIYDPAPVHGCRWVVLGQPPLGRQPVVMWVVSLDETTFRRIHPAPTHPQSAR